MEIIDREEKLCLACMERHIVYKVTVDGKKAEYCHRSDSLLQRLVDGMTHNDLIK